MQELWLCSERTSSWLAPPDPGQISPSTRLTVALKTWSVRELGTMKLRPVGSVYHAMSKAPFS